MDAPDDSVLLGDLLRLRQTIRPSNRLRLHVVEFDATVLVLAECGDNVTLLESTPIDDLVSHSDRAHTYSDAGVNLKDTPLDEAEEHEPRSLADFGNAGPQGRRAVTASSLADFKTVLQKARRGQP